jgi:hypothetical protein
MESDYRQVLKRVGLVLLGIGLLDVGVMVCCIANRLSYSSSFNLFAVIGGIFLIRGSLRTAAFVGWFSVIMLTGFLAMVAVLPFLQPLDLSLTELRLNPGSFAAGVILYVLVLGFLLWLSQQLGLESVEEAVARAGLKRRDIRYAAAAGVGLALVLGITVPLVTNGESAARAKSIARQQVGTAYQFHVKSVQISSGSHGSSALWRGYCVESPRNT